MRKHVVLLLAALAPLAGGQQPCAPTPVWSACEIELPIAESDLGVHPDPSATVDIWGEFRSPEFKTFRLPAFWDGRGMRLRFAPDKAGPWTVRLSGNIELYDGKTLNFLATPSEAPGFLRPANLHFWIHPDVLKPHLWIGDTRANLFSMPRAEFDRLLTARAGQKFTHLRGFVMHGAPPDTARLNEMDARVAAIGARGMVTGIVLAPTAGDLEKAFPTFAQRERFLRNLVARYAAYKTAWEMAGAFEDDPNGRAVVRELGLAFRKLDPYNHPASAGSNGTSSALLGDKWMTHIVHHSPEPALGSVEHQLYQIPQVNTGFARPGETGEAFRKRLWNATMNGQHPMSEIGAFESEDTDTVKHWASFFERTRYWELQPFFDLDGGRAVAVRGFETDFDHYQAVEYVVYIEKPGPVEVRVGKHTYDVYWFDPASGESKKEKKQWKGDVFTATPPDSSRDWVLHLSRDGRKQGMLRRYKFESRPQRMYLQEIEANPQRIPYELVEPQPGETLLPGQPVPYRIKLKRETGGTRRMFYLIMGEVVRDMQGSRVLATGPEGSFTIPPLLLREPGGVLNLHVHGLNAAGKLYTLDLVHPVKQAQPPIKSAP
jgi:hypothetical protein